MNVNFINANGEPVKFDETKPLTWRISVYGLIISQNKLLLVKQGNTHRYQLPGGGVEIDESHHAALKREILEETGCRFMNTSA